MSRDQVVEMIRSHRADLERFDVKSLSLFGSVARDEAREGSDVDVLVEFASPATFDSYFGLKEYLEELLGRPVDLVTPGALRPFIEPQVRREALRVA